jgi:hypothetical protein
MKVECIANHVSELPPRYAADFGLAKEAEYELKKGDIYRVHGICLDGGLLFYLVLSDSVNAPYCPEWCYSDFFRVIDGSLDENWVFSKINELPSGVVEAVIGYPELTDRSSHFEDLTERKSEAMLIFQNNTNVS